MKPTHTHNISCIIFGHNFYKLLDDANKNQLRCKHCNAALDIEDFENSHLTEAVDKTFKNTLRRLFLLKRNVA